jgi:hypothetical protein
MKDDGLRAYDAYTSPGNYTYPLGYVGATLAPNGSIYYMPADSILHGSNPSYYYPVLKFNPKTRAVSYPSYTYSTNSSNAHYYAHALLASNGKIYSLPSYATANGGLGNKFNIQPLVIDPTDDSTYRIYAEYTGADYASSMHFGRGALAPNGKIYASEWYIMGDILELDPATDTITRITGLNMRTKAMTLAPNGCLYGIGSNTRSVFKFDPDLQVKTDIGTTTNAYSNYNSTSNNRIPVLFTDGKIYAFSEDNCYLLIIDTSNDTFEEVPFASDGDFRLMNFLSDGLLYSYSYQSGGKILRWNPPLSNYTLLNAVAWANNTSKYGALAPNGMIYYDPSKGSYNNPYVIPAIGYKKNLPPYLLMPTDLSLLATSEYNLYCNH